MKRSRLSGLVVALAAALTPFSALGCAFHGYLPEPTLVDQIMMADEAVLARNTAANPSRFVPVLRLRGLHPTSPIPMPVTAETRARFAVDPDLTILMVRIDGYGPWSRAGVIDAPMRAVIDDVMTLLPEWELGDGTERAQYFATLLASEHAALRDMARQELDIISYDRLKIAVQEVAPDVLRSAAREGSRDAIRILLAGLSGDAGFEPMLRDGVEQTLGTQDFALGAYATALMELEGPSAIERLAREILVDPRRDLADQTLLIEGFALQALSPDPDIRALVQAEMTRALNAAPTLAPLLAERFALNWDWSLAEPMAEILRSGKLTHAGDVIAVAQYVNLARQDAQTQD